jgi:hypothetical protein
MSSPKPCSSTTQDSPAVGTNHILAGGPLSKAAERRLRKRKSQQIAAEKRAAESPAPTYADPRRQARHEQAEARHLEASGMVRSRYRLQLRASHVSVSP